MRAWIEIKIFSFLMKWNICRPLHEGVDWNVLVLDTTEKLPCRPLHEGVDWNSSGICTVNGIMCRPLHEGVDWNRLLSVDFTIFLRRPLHEGVDWNSNYLRYHIIHKVALFMRAWIEIATAGSRRCSCTSPSSWGRGLKWHVFLPLLYHLQSPSSWGRGLK